MTMFIKDETTPRSYVTITDPRTRKSSGFTVYGAWPAETEQSLKSSVAAKGGRIVQRPKRRKAS